MTLELCFKGKRTYIQGGDMLNVTAAAATQASGANTLQQLDFMINRMSSHRLGLVLDRGDELPATPEPPVATLSFQADGRQWRGMLVEETGEPDCRHPYDEEAIIALCKLEPEKRSITLTASAGHTPIEVIVAMTKALHLALFPEAPGKWVFCRWESECWPLELPPDGYSVVLNKTLGSRLTRSGVMAGERRVGWIYFSAKAGS